jgi:cytochrome c553|tara:strand:- start:7150 stop:7953 length:804 start_codon:yes stop_codon:yes gene_type:complete
MHEMKKLPVFLWTCALVLLAANDAVAEGRDSAKIYGASCAVCHGDKGEGKTIGINRFPAIAGLQKWYIQDQLIKFKYDGRGADYRDKGGLMMHAMVRTLKPQRSKDLEIVGEPEIEGIADYISNLPVDNSSKLEKESDDESLNASIERGRKIYTAEAPSGCVLCHGDKFQGNNKEDVNKLLPRAPMLVPLDDWYMLEQLGKFREGVRGPVADTKRAKQLLGEKAKLKMSDQLDGPALMQAMSLTALVNKQAVKDVVAYIYSETHPSN